MLRYKKIMPTRNRRCSLFDMDSTLIEQEVIDELAIEAGVGQQVAEITERAMQGRSLIFSKASVHVLPY